MNKRTTAKLYFEVNFEKGHRTINIQRIVPELLYLGRSDAEDHQLHLSESHHYLNT